MHRCSPRHLSHSVPILVSLITHHIEVFKCSPFNLPHVYRCSPRYPPQSVHVYRRSPRHPPHRFPEIATLFATECTGAAVLATSHSPLELPHVILLMDAGGAWYATLPTGHSSSSTKSSVEAYLTLPSAPGTVNVKAGTFFCVTLVHGFVL